MKNYLVKFEDNWADEMDIEGFKVFQAEDEEEIKNSLVNENVEFPCERGIGTNEYLEYETKEDYFNRIEITEITEEEFNMLNKFFPYGGGHFVQLDY